MVVQQTSRKKGSYGIHKPNLPLTLLKGGQHKLVNIKSKVRAPDSSKTEFEKLPHMHSYSSVEKSNETETENISQLRKM